MPKLWRTRLDVSRSRGFSRFVGRGDEMQVLEAALKGLTAIQAPPTVLEPTTELLRERGAELMVALREYEEAQRLLNTEIGDAGDREHDLARADAAARGLDTADAAGRDVESRHFALLDDVDAERAGRTRVGPGHRVVPHRAAAAQRGVRVRIVTNSLASTDVGAVHAEE